jgi:hypothetical protein
MKDVPEENIVWENEVDCSYNIHLLNGQGSITPSCDYPSIVVRMDSTSGHVQAFIVYSCDRHDANTDNIIAETKLTVDTNSIYWMYGNMLCGVRGKNRTEWCNPVISATGNGLYYAWSDSLIGIVAGWKNTNKDTFRLSTPGPDTCRISYWRHYRNTPHTKPWPYLCQHPSLNTYSALHVDATPSHTEDNCSVVWQEKITPYTPPVICYTRLRMKDTNDSLKFFLPKIQDYSLSTLDLNRDTTVLIVNVRADSFPCGFPVINRFLDDYDYRSTAANRNEKIYWEKYSYGCGDQDWTLGSRSIFLRDTANQCVSWYVYEPYNIYATCNWSTQNCLTQPDIAHGGLRDLPSGYLGNQLLLSFKKKYYNVYQQPQRGYQIYVIPHNWDTFEGANQLVQSDQNSYLVRSVSNSDSLNYCHLSKALKRLLENPFYGTDYKDKLIYQYNTDSTLVPTARGHYRTGDVAQEKEHYDCMVGFGDFADRYMIATPQIDEQNISLVLPFDKIEDKDFGDKWKMVKRDTIFSYWFTVGNSNKLNFKALGLNTEKYQMKIQSQLTGKITDMNLLKANGDSLGILNKFTLINGLNDQYRLVFINTDKKTNYFEEVYLGGLPVSNAVARQGEKEEIIDLNGATYQDATTDGIKISVFPNPVDELLYTTAYLPTSYFTDNSEYIKSGKIILKVFSQLGVELYRQEVNAGQTISINTSNFPTGTYFIRAEESEWSLEQKMSTQSFIINR